MCTMQQSSVHDDIIFWNFEWDQSGARQLNCTLKRISAMKLASSRSLILARKTWSSFNLWRKKITKWITESIAHKYSHSTVQCRKTNTVQKVATEQHTPKSHNTTLYAHGPYIIALSLSVCSGWSVGWRHNSWIEIKCELLQLPSSFAMLYQNTIHTT